MDAPMAVYGVRDIFVGAATYAAAYRNSLGGIVLASSGVAFADVGLICKLNGREEWNWS